MKAGIPEVVQRRIACLFLIFTLLIAGGLSRLFYLQVGKNHVYHEKAITQRLRVMPLPAHRGLIYDRNRHELALTINSPGVLATPEAIVDPQNIAAQLAPTIDLSTDQIVNLLERNSSQVWLARRRDSVQSQLIKDMGLPGIQLVARPERFYPNDQLAAHLLGIVGIDNQGLEGLEYRYDEILRGISGRIARETDVTGRPIPGGMEKLIPSQSGGNLVLTIDKMIQYIAERELTKAIGETGAKQGVFLVMNPQTGELLAAAVQPSFEPWDYQNHPSRRNVAFTDQYEPGSTFKIFTAAAALEEGLVDAHSPFYDKGHLTIGGITVRCWRPGGHGEINFQQAMESSCNTTFAQISGDMLDSQIFHRYLRSFGFGGRLGIDFPGEASGIVPSPGSRWGEKAQWATIGFGQGIAVTPLQLLTATSAVANGGVLMQPYLVKQILDGEGAVVEQFLPNALRQVISPGTAHELNRLLRSVVTNGSGAGAEIQGFPAAGKTGTAEVPDSSGGYGQARIASFVGYAPFDDPQLAGLVILYEPQGSVSFGGVLAAPVFARGMADMLTYLQIPAREIAQANPFLENSGYINIADLYPGLERGYDGARVAVPNLLGLSLRDAVGVLAQVGLTIDIRGSGLVVAQEPDPGEELGQGQQVKIRLDWATL